VKLTIVVPDEPPTLNAALEGLVRINEAMMLAAIKSGKPLPPLYQSGIRYGEEPHGREWWQTVADNFAELEHAKKKQKKSTTDCEDLAGHRAAELRVWGPAWPSAVVAGSMAGIPYPARAICIRTGPRMYHAIVEHPDGTREDPSRALGMGSHRQASPLRRKSNVNQEPGIYFNTFRGPRGVWRADLKLNTDETGNGYTIRGAHMGGWFDAVKHLVTKAVNFVESPAGTVALTAAFGPVGPLAAHGALVTIHQLAQAANQSDPGEQLGQVAKKFTNPTLKHLATNFSRIAKGKASSMSGGPCCLGDMRQLRAELESKGASPGQKYPAGLDPWPLASVNGAGPEMVKAMMQANPFAALSGMSPLQQQYARDAKKLADDAKDELLKKQQALNLDYQRRLARAQRA
jgi:hypothetical protein